MEEYSLAYLTLTSTAAAATTIISDFCRLPKISEPSQVDVQRIVYLQKLADELERGLSDAKRILEETPPLAALKDLKAVLSDLLEKSVACLQQWRKEGGRNLTPPVLWRRLEETDKALKILYQDVCDLIFFAEAEEEEAEPMPPGMLEDLVRAAHQQEREKVPH